jgi:uncharacterized Zn finger protein
MFKKAKPKKPDSFAYQCDRCGFSDDIPADVIEYFDATDPGLPGQPATFRCELCPGIMYPVSYLRAKRVPAKQG